MSDEQATEKLTHSPGTDQAPAGNGEFTTTTTTPAADDRRTPAAARGPRPAGRAARALTRRSLVARAANRRLAPRRPHPADRARGRGPAPATPEGLDRAGLEALLLLVGQRWLRDAGATRVETAIAGASAVGVVIEARHAQLSLALDALFRARFHDAAGLVESAWQDVDRLRLPGLGSRALAVRALIHAHQGDRDALDVAAARFDDWRGAREDEVPIVEGLGRAVCDLLHGDTDAARARLHRLRAAGGGAAGTPEHAGRGAYGAADPYGPGPYGAPGSYGVPGAYAGTGPYGVAGPHGAAGAYAAANPYAAAGAFAAANPYAMTNPCGPTNPYAADPYAAANPYAGTGPHAHADARDLCGQHGLTLLLDCVAGTATRPDHAAVAAHPAARIPWNACFVHLAAAVLAGREGDARAAETALAQALAVAADLPSARHLGLGLVAGAADRDGWGEPVRWLQEAESFYAAHGIHPAVRQCRSRLRDLRATVRQRRSGSAEVPERLWRLGVTVREFEVLTRLGRRHTNREIAAELHLSHRTVERHVANLLEKTQAANRRELGALLAAGAREPVGEFG